MPELLWRPWRRAFDFRGRSTRREYWLFYVQLILAYLLLAMLLVALDGLAGGGGVGALAGIPFILLIAFGFVATLSASVRRLHDHDKSGWFYLFSLVPFVGWLFFLFMMLTPGTKGENSYGYDPREGDQPPANDVAEIFS